MDESRTRRVSLNPFAHARHMDVHRPRVAIRAVVLPDLLQDLGTRQHDPVVACQVGQQVELATLEADPPVTDPHLAATTVDGDPIEMQDLPVG
jgi:hypothetical protein